MKAKAGYPVPYSVLARLPFDEKLEFFFVQNISEEDAERINKILEEQDAKVSAN